MCVNYYKNTCVKVKQEINIRFKKDSKDTNIIKGHEYGWWFLNYPCNECSIGMVQDNTEKHMYWVEFLIYLKKSQDTHKQIIQIYLWK